MPTDPHIFWKNKLFFEENIIISLDYMANGNTLASMADRYRGDWTRYSFMVNFCARFTRQKYYNLVVNQLYLFLAKWMNVGMQYGHMCVLIIKGNSVSILNLSSKGCFLS